MAQTAKDKADEKKGGHKANLKLDREHPKREGEGPEHHMKMAQHHMKMAVKSAATKHADEVRGGRLANFKEGHRKTK